MGMNCKKMLPPVPCIGKFQKIAVCRPYSKMTHKSLSHKRTKLQIETTLAEKLASSKKSRKVKPFVVIDVNDIPVEESSPNRLVTPESVSKENPDEVTEVSEKEREVGFETQEKSEVAMDSSRKSTFRYSLKVGQEFKSCSFTKITVDRSTKGIDFDSLSSLERESEEVNYVERMSVPEETPVATQEVQAEKIQIPGIKGVEELKSVATSDKGINLL
ncbi:hypothetical protein CFOL_v3_09996 [Cephalotus follicularis]|uniref:Uncharacterized protein n=1 Tax=Cephalotus follicularis TaxID=3775 RepID=A0A1Q3BEM9_CEPFO|nr:hypothetical protein CFOL_v3_09996 [Cephalotus follicularis]